jgi:hypothetical protein
VLQNTSLKYLQITNTLTYWACSYVTNKMKCCEYTPTFTTLELLHNLRISPIRQSVTLHLIESPAITNTLTYWACSYVKNKMKCCEYTPTFTTLEFLHNLRISPISLSVTLHLIEISANNKYSNLLGLFVCYKQMKCCKYTPTFTTLEFLHNLRISPLRQSVTLHLIEIPANNKYSNLLGLFVCYKQNEVL